MRVRRAIDELGVDVELRNIFEDPEHLQALREARGTRVQNGQPSKW